jgi:lysophospholipase L1-like esterase
MTSFAALGDSFTAGAGCPPGASWADRLARSLSANDPWLVYRNFAEDGATSSAVMEQVDKAVRLTPDLVTLICGVNDVLHSTRPDIDAYAERLDSMLDLLEAGERQPLVITATAPENLHFLDLGPRTERRLRDGLQRLNGETRRIATRHRVSYLEVVGHPGLRDPANFLDDGIHPSEIGHAHAAEAFERLLAEGEPVREAYL